MNWSTLDYCGWLLSCSALEYSAPTQRWLFPRTMEQLVWMEALPSCSSITILKVPMPTNSCSSSMEGVLVLLTLFKIVSWAALSGQIQGKALPRAMVQLSILTTKGTFRLCKKLILSFMTGLKWWFNIAMGSSEFRKKLTLSQRMEEICISEEWIIWSRASNI